MNSQRWRRRTLIALVFVLAAAVLVESWQAAMHAAETGGRPTPALWPVCLEGFIFVLVLVYWDAKSDHRKAPWVRTLLVLVTLAAAGVQALDAPRTWLGWVTAALTPIILLGTVEFAVWLLYGGAVAAQESTSRKVQTPRSSEQAAGSVAVIGGHTVVPEGTPVANEPRGVYSPGGPATPPPSTPVPVAVDADSLTAGEAGSLPDEPRPVTPVAPVPTDRDQTVAPLLPKHDEALRRRKDRPDEFAQYITAKGLDRDAIMAMAARRGWPVANGHREAVPA